MGFSIFTEFCKDHQNHFLNISITAERNPMPFSHQLTSWEFLPIRHGEHPVSLSRQGAHGSPHHGWELSGTLAGQVPAMLRVGQKWKLVCSLASSVLDWRHVTWDPAGWLGPCWAPWQMSSFVVSIHEGEISKSYHVDDLKAAVGELCLYTFWKWVYSKKETGSKWTTW